MSDTGTALRAIKLHDPVWITLADGCRLAARIWLPEDADSNPVPAILEYVPYRRRDFTAIRDAMHHRYFAERGYAAVRVDLRGSGDSDGVLEDEYLQRELEDGAEVIAWLARQPWCSGTVGMMGISWGGFNALQVAALRPPALKAIITVASTDDRFADDVHAMGGCLLADCMVWASTMFGFNSRPPDPAVVGDSWRATWQQRLAHGKPWVVEWLSHQTRDAFFKHGSVCEDYGAITAAVFAVGGWADGYSNAVPRLLQGLSCPRKGLIGPWAHNYPYAGRPGPAIGWLQEATRWWDHWLKGRDTGIMAGPKAEPMYRAWMQESVPPLPQYDARDGRWVAEDGWPSPRTEQRRLALNPGTIDAKAGPAKVLFHDTPESVGHAAGEWCAYGYDSELPYDQRVDDAGSLVFDSAPLDSRLEILGAPVAELELSVDRPFAFVAVRLNDVAPTGASTRVTYGLLNLMFREGFANPKPIAPGERYRVAVKLNDIAHAFPQGHRMRLAISTGYWPLVWPSPEPVRLALVAGASTLTIPVRAPRPEDERLPAFGPPESSPALAHVAEHPYRRSRSISRDVATGEVTIETIKDRGRYRLNDTGVTYSGKGVDRYHMRDGQPLSARIDSFYEIGLEGPGWHTRTECRTVVTATKAEFLVSASLDAYEGEARVFADTYSARVPRCTV